jgi:hypothetical protein
MTNISVRPEDGFPMDVLVGVGEVPITPPLQVPPTGLIPVRKNKRCIYEITLSDLSGMANWIEFRIYSNPPAPAPPVLEGTVRIPLIMNDTVIAASKMCSPLMSIPANKFFRAIANAASVQVHMMAYDL